METPSHADFFSSIKPNKWAVMLNTGYFEYETVYGVSGLAKTVGDRLDLLAVVSDHPGTGQFHNFMMAAKQTFNTICLWAEFNPDIGIIMERWGFIRAQYVNPTDKEVVKGWKWKQRYEQKNENQFPLEKTR